MFSIKDLVYLNFFLGLEFSYLPNGMTCSNTRRSVSGYLMLFRNFPLAGNLTNSLPYLGLPLKLNIGLEQLKHMKLLGCLESKLEVSFSQPITVHYDNQSAIYTATNLIIPNVLSILLSIVTSLEKRLWMVRFNYLTCLLGLSL